MPATEHDQLAFPDPSKSYVSEVLRYDPEHLRQIDVGLTKDQVRHSLGNPHFSEGVFSPKTWNYIIGLPEPNSREYQPCQLRIDFDKDNLVERYNWKESDCAELLQVKQPAQAVSAVPAVQIVTAEQPATNTMTSKDFIFRFNRSSLADITSGSVEQLVADIHSNFKDIKQVSVIGYADKIGQADANASLSLARATTIANALISHGIAEQLIHTGGQGATSEFVECTGSSVNPQLIDCLKQNRRVVVTVTGY
ncbi:outer membrane protein assembly factor BamE [Alkanindiges sp. WGS2144]|uniref:OmpA family protein n=1 Tax=Alkanindiges sp. WGS2144 TaxID=3366808 RepID=UPI0037512BC0